MNKTELLSTLKIYSTKYIDEIIKYLELAKTSSVIMNNTDRKLTHIGYRIITHIFQTNLIRTGDIYIVNYSMQKGYLYYLEYLEQIEKNNQNDVLVERSPMLFIYDKTIIKNKIGDSDPIKIDQSVLSIVPRITKLIDTILWLDNNYIEQTEIDFDIVKSICELLDTTKDNLMSSYIEFGQKRTMTTTIEYNEFLNCTLKIIREDAARKKYNESDWVLLMLKKFPYIEEVKNQDMYKWCKWLWF